MWIGVLWAGLRVALWIAHVGGKYRHGLLEKSLKKNAPLARFQVPFFWAILTVKLAKCRRQTGLMPVFPFFLWGDPVQNRPQNPAPASCLFSTRKTRSEVPGRKLPGEGWGGQGQKTEKKRMYKEGGRVFWGSNP